jgi:hypothetical protein
MALTLREQLGNRLAALRKQRTEKAATFAGELSRIDAQVTAIQSLAQNWDTLTLDEALALLAQTGVSLELKS